MDHPSRPKTKSSPQTLDLVPDHGEMIKPAELIEISGASHLTLSARRLYNQLVAHAFGPKMGIAGQEWTIQIAELRGMHDSNDRLADSIVALMKTVVTVRLANGQTRRVQLLGGNDMHDEGRSRGLLTYSFDRRLVELLGNSTVRPPSCCAVRRAGSRAWHRPCRLPGLSVFRPAPNHEYSRGGGESGEADPELKRHDAKKHRTFLSLPEQRRKTAHVEHQQACQHRPPDHHPTCSMQQELLGDRKAGRDPPNSGKVGGGGHFDETELEHGRFRRVVRFCSQWMHIGITDPDRLAERQSSQVTAPAQGGPSRRLFHSMLDLAPGLICGYHRFGRRRRSRPGRSPRSYRCLYRR